MSAWQPIESAPRDGRWVLGAYADSGHILTVAWDSFAGSAGGWADGSLDEDGDQLTYPVAHWMPLPAPPSSGEPPSRVGQGANAYTAEGKETRDDLNYTLPQPSDATELVEEIRGYVRDGFTKPSASTLRKWAEALSQAQARATAAEGTERRLRLQMLEISEHAGAHLCRAERAEAALAQAEGELPSREEMEAALAEKLRQSGGAMLFVHEAADAILALRKPSSATKGPADVAE